MTGSDLGQMFNLRKTAPTAPQHPDQPPSPASPPEAPPNATPGVAAAKAEPVPQPRTTPTKATKTKRTAVQQATAAPREPVRPAAEYTATEADTAAAGEGQPRSATSTGGRASIMLYTTQTVRERMKEEAQRTSLSYGQLTLLCIESTLGSLEQVFAARVGATSQLFSSDYKPRNRTGETRSANLNLHIARRDLDVVESLWQRFPGCRSRNDLLSTACALHLTGEGDA